MNSGSNLTHEFVEYVPRELKDGVLYVSVRFATVIHKCCCGCGQQVVTPLAPAQWTLLFDGQSISLHPSIGNWNFPCRSHYWIRQNKVIWARRWSAGHISAAQRQDAAVVQSQFLATPETQEKRQDLSSERPAKRDGFLRRCKGRLFGK
jgi:hypothetical protein